MSRTGVRRFLWSLFVLCDAMLVWAFAAGYAAWYVPPRHVWWLELFGITLPYTSMLLVLVFLVVAVALRPRLTVLHAVLLVLILARFFPFGTASWFEESEPDDLTVLTYNVPFGDLLIDDPHARRPPIRRLLEAEQPDLIAFQEINLYIRNGRILEEENLATITPTPDYRFARPEPFEGRVVIKAPLITHVPTGPQQIIPIEYSRPPGERVAVTRTPFKWRGRPAVHYNVYLQSYAPPPYIPKNTSDLTPRAWLARLANSEAVFEARAEEAEQIRLMLDRETVPVIVTGDFNCTPHNWPYRHIAAGMVDAYKAAGTGWGATWHRRTPFARIDYVLVSPEWEVVSAHVPPSTLSDHRPVVARLRWNK